MGFSVFYTPCVCQVFFSPNISCWYFIFLYLDEFLSHPQHSQILFYAFCARCWHHFFQPHSDSGILSDVVFSFSVCVPTPVAKEQPTFWFAKPWLQHFPALNYFLTFLSRSIETLQVAHFSTLLFSFGFTAVHPFSTYSYSKQSLRGVEREATLQQDLAANKVRWQHEGWSSRWDRAMPGRNTLPAWV